MDPPLVKFGLQDSFQPVVFAQVASFFQAEQFFVRENCDKLIVSVAVSIGCRFHRIHDAQCVCISIAILRNSTQ